jgi:NodT family efflux transporter outer membrane factor (OMF) lipoprotein
MVWRLPRSAGLSGAHARKLIWIAWVPYALAACTVGPDYVKPDAQTPAAFKEVPKEDSPWKVASPRDAIHRGSWWEIFGDAQLNELAAQINISNQNLKVAESNYRQARALAQQARSGYFPTVTGGATAQRYRQSANVPARTAQTVGPNNDFLLPLDVSWEIDLWGRIRRSVESSQASAQASAADLETVRLSLQSELASDYFELRGLDAERKLLEQTLVAYRKALELTQNRFSGGIASQADVALAETQLNTTLAQTIELGVQRAQLEHAIALLIGKPASEFTLAEAPYTQTPPAIPVGLPSELLERRPDIASAERQVASANAQIGVAKAAYYPTVTLDGLVGFQSGNFSNWLSWSSRLWALGATGSQTIFDGGRRRAVTDQALAAYDGTVAGYRETVLSAFRDVEDNLAELRILAEESQAQDNAVTSSKRSLTFITNRYVGGAATYLDVVVVQAVALSNERTSIQISRRRMSASVRLIKAVGGGWQASDLPSAKDVLVRGENTTSATQSP